MYRTLPSPNSIFKTTFFFNKYVESWSFVVVSVVCYSHSNKKQLQAVHVCVKNNQLLQQKLFLFLKCLH